MNDEEFKRRLSEVAEWEMPKLSDTDVREAKKRARGRGRPTNEELFQQEHEEIFKEIFDGINPTIKPVLTKIIHQPHLCECGKICEDGCPKDIKLYHIKGQSHWRQKCLNCGMTQNPYTGKFNLTAQKALGVWTSFLRETKGVYNSKGNIAKAALSTANKLQHQTVITNEQETITFYHDNKSET
jgi:hypothetical protein